MVKAVGGKVWAANYNCGGCYWCETIKASLILTTSTSSMPLETTCDASNASDRCACDNIIDDWNFFSQMGSRFNFVWMNDDSLDQNCWPGNFSWLNSYGVPGAWWYHGGSAVETTLKAFTDVAFQYGWLQGVNQLWNFLYTCQQNKVAFYPPGGLGDYYGVWNGSEYTGPVDPNSPGATLCWVLTSETATGQYSQPYSYT